MTDFDRVAYLGALFLAAVFVVAAVAKLRDAEGTTRTFASLGLPAPGVFARAVPLLELAVAVLLAVVPWLGGLAAVASLAAFTALLAGEVRSGSGVSCGCFGTASAQPISFVELVRNALLAIPAVTACLAGGPTAPNLPSVVTVTAAFAAGSVVLALASLRRDVGAVWDNRLAGEAPA